MDDDACRRFFMEPEQTFHRRYEALRTLFVEGHSLEATAARFGYRVTALRSVVSRFRADCRNDLPPPFFFRTDAGAPPASDVAKTRTGLNWPTLPTGGN